MKLKFLFRNFPEEGHNYNTGFPIVCKSKKVAKDTGEDMNTLYFAIIELRPDLLGRWIPYKLTRLS